MMRVTPARKGRAANWAWFMSMLDEWASTRTMEECEAILTAGSVPCSRYYTVREALAASASCGARQLRGDRRRRGAAQGAESRVQVRQRDRAARNYVPALGADNAAVLSSVLGYSGDRIAALYEKQILHDDAAA